MFLCTFPLTYAVTMRALADLSRNRSATPYMLITAGNPYPAFERSDVLRETRLHCLGGAWYKFNPEAAMNTREGELARVITFAS